MIRVGSIIQRKDPRSPHPYYSPRCTGRGQKGTVIAVVEDDSGDYDSPITITGITVRWHNGFLESIEFSDETNTDIDDFIDATPCTFVNVYNVDRRYGGPEEGGWWYDCWVPDEQYSKSFARPSTANRYFKVIGDRLMEENKHRRPIHSVLSDGEWRVVLDAYPPEVRPARRPRYC